MLAAFIGGIGGVFVHDYTAKQYAQPQPHYYYTVGHKVKAYVGGKQVEIKDYQEQVGVKPDGKFGYDTCTATNFYNAQRKMGLK